MICCLFPSTLLDYRYYLALTLPNGSTQISISEVTPSTSNYIALKAQRSQYFINGNFRVLHAGHTPLTFAGSLWSYKRLNDGAESIQTDGQTDQKVGVYVLASQVYDGITFSFNLPNSKMEVMDVPVFFWRASDWQSCDIGCGRGHQERIVTCNKLLPGSKLETQVSDSMCVSLKKPILQQECSMELCHYTWVVSEWGQCNVSCGVGIETRNVTCQGNISGDYVAVDDNFCPDEQAHTVRTCNRACQYEWDYGEWRSCDSVCGEGWMKREVWCVSGMEEKVTVSSSLCLENNKPKDQVTCQSSAGNCSDYQWALSDWSEVKQILDQLIKLETHTHTHTQLEHRLSVNYLN